MLFQDKVVVVTGGAQGIGQCCAECFEREGAHVHVIDIQLGPWFAGDLADKSVLERFAAEIITKSGHVDVLVNNAMPLFKGIDEYAPMKSLPMLRRSESLRHSTSRSCSKITLRKVHPSSTSRPRATG
jgi:NAD(P)-dependent dehydrogenase (short-subunit alcohol dehydrogenase family)